MLLSDAVSLKKNVFRWKNDTKKKREIFSFQLSLLTFYLKIHVT